MRVLPFAALPPAGVPEGMYGSYGWSRSAISVDRDVFRSVRMICDVDCLSVDEMFALNLVTR